MRPGALVTSLLINKMVNTPESMFWKYWQFFGSNIFVLVYLLCNFVVFLVNKDNRNLQKKERKGELEVASLTFRLFEEIFAFVWGQFIYLFRTKKLFLSRRKNSCCFDQNGWCLLQTKYFQLNIRNKQNPFGNLFHHQYD